jgi:hypothetical protein
MRILLVVLWQMEMRKGRRLKKRTAVSLIAPETGKRSGFFCGREGQKKEL